MSKANEKAVGFFQRQRANHKPEFQEAFELKEANKSPHFKTEFLVAALTQEESSQIQHILLHEQEEELGADRKLSSDHRTLVDLTTQIRAIDRQSALLHGERIHKAREILKNYKDGAFTRWLMLAYGNRQTPYSMLQYYEFFKTLKSDLQQLMQAMPKKAAYVLASRNGDPQKKINIIREHHASSPKEIIKLVQETFPIHSKDGRKRKENDAALVESMRGSLLKLVKRKNALSHHTLAQMYALRSLMDEILMP